MLFEKQKIKVAHSLGALNMGGTETLLLDLLNYKDNAFCDMLVIYRKEGNSSDRFYLSDVPIYKISLGKFWMLMSYLLKLRKLIRTENVNIIHSHQRMDTILSWLASLGLPVKIVQTIHDFDFKYTYFNKLLISTSIKLCKWNIFVSEHQKEYYRNAYNLRGKTAISIIPNGINFEKFNVKIYKSLREELGINGHTLLLGMVGNFNAGHDHMTICRFLRLLTIQGFNFRFLFIGKIDEANPHFFNDCHIYCLNNGLSEKVHFLGFRDDVPFLLSQIDIFLYSTDYDTFGIAVIEAIAQGIPVFTNDWDVMKEITENGKRAILYQTKNEYDLLNKFILFISDEDFYRKKNHENMKWAQTKYSIQKHFAQLQHIYSILETKNY